MAARGAVAAEAVKAEVLVVVVVRDGGVKQQKKFEMSSNKLTKYFIRKLMPAKHSEMH